VIEVELFILKFQAAVLCLINTVVQTAPNPTSQFFHQMLFVEAGFDPLEVERVRILKKRKS